MDDMAPTENDNVSGTAGNNIYYTLFKRSGIPVDFVVLISIRWLLGMAGFLLNAALVFVSVRTNFLFGTCNFLIGFNAFCATVSSPFLSIGLVLALTRIGFISIWNCFLLQLVPMLSSNLFMASMFAIGVDRLLSIVCSLWHQQLNKTNYLSVVLALCFFYACLVVFLCYEGVQENHNLFVLCANPGETYQGDIGNTLFRMNLGLVCLTIVCYFVLWMLLRCKKTKEGCAFTQKILKSLLCMMLIITIGYVLSVSTRIVAPYLTMSLSQVAYCAFITSIFSVVAMGANAPVLFVFSQDYKKAFRRQFPRIFRSNPNQVVSYALAVQQTRLPAPQIGWIASSSATNRDNM